MMPPTLDDLIAQPQRIAELSPARKRRILWAALWRVVVLQGRIVKLRIGLWWLYGLRFLAGGGS
jgi:hypothetical protein